jgi:mRNA interferase MazF
MTSYSFGDVVLVPFPFTDQTTSKKRPAVIISSAAYHLQHSDVIVMAITGAQTARRSGEASINDWQMAGLIKPSIIKPIISTLEATLVIRKLGQLSSDDQSQLRQVLRVVLG